ncbi:autotransporter domain-containing protein [Marinagarivorans cellulosilyticus]|uniref:Autotransporter domain-containing protein n=1 Tax=Marinagarivorans cellulosilyticus TaxID=2721545 RepID=A0AAN1WKZ0_9GAMM|nr:autotransporter domain-containing protein [Marinagarivorans cellulosilyticus]BCD99521.1 hypothetical protein MARGE09_P3723 [Marinagarivorans cellulosilyticus]
MYSFCKGILPRLLSIFVGLVVASTCLAAPTANPDNVVALKNEVVTLNVLANDTGEGVLLLGALGSSSNIFIDFSVDGMLEIKPFEDFVGRVTFVYSVVDDSLELDRGLVTIDFIDPESESALDSSSLDDVAPINQLMYSAAAALDGHSRSISQFLKLRQAGSTIGGDLAYWTAPQGGAAGDDTLPLGGVFVSLNRQSIDSKLGGEVGADVAGATLGADFNINSQWLVGGALGYSDGEQASTANSAGDAWNMDEKSLLAFTSLRAGRWLGEMQMGYSTAEFDTAKALAVDADAQFALIKGEYALTGQAWQIMPGASLKYRRNTVDSFSASNESGAIYYDDHSKSHLSGVLSLYGNYAFNFNWGVLMPQLTLASDYCIDSKQSGQGVNFDGQWSLLIPATEDKHQLSIDIGLGAMFMHGFSGFINYHQISQYDAYDQSGWSLGGRWEF